MSSDTDSRSMNLQFGLSIRCVDCSCDIKTMKIGKARQLIGQRDIDIAISSLGELNKFCFIG